MKRFLQNSLAAILLAGIPAGRPVRAGDPLRFLADPLKFPDNIHLGEVAGVATNSQGKHLRLHAHRPSDDLPRHLAALRARRFAAVSSSIRPANSFARSGRIRTRFLVAQQVRVDPQDNIWVVDQMSSMVIKFDPNGQVQLLLGRKAESETRAGQAARSSPALALPGGRTRPRWTSRRGRSRATSFNGPPTWRGTPPETSTWPMASATPASPSSTRTASSSSPGDRKGHDPGQFNTAARDRHRCARQRVCRRRRKQEDSGLRRRRELSRRRSSTWELPPRFASRLERINISTAQIRIRRTISTRTARSTSWNWTGKIVGQIRQGGKAAEGVRHRQRHRLPHARTISMWARSATGECKNSPCTPETRGAGR